MVDRIIIIIITIIIIIISSSRSSCSCSNNNNNNNNWQFFLKIKNKNTKLMRVSIKIADITFNNFEIWLKTPLGGEKYYYYYYYYLLWQGSFRRYKGTLTDSVAPLRAFSWRIRLLSISLSICVRLSLFQPSSY